MQVPTLEDLYEIIMKGVYIVNFDRGIASCKCVVLFIAPYKRFQNLNSWMSDYVRFFFFFVSPFKC